MNKALLLLLLVDEARRQASRYEGYRREVKLEECLVELNNRRPIELPSHLPQEPESMLAVLQQLGPRIGLLSLVLSQEFPDKFLLYRAPLLDREIFDGLAFFADLEPSFRFPFASVGNDLDAAERQLIQALTPCFNVSLNAAPISLPSMYRPVNANFRFRHGLNHLKREAERAVKADEAKAWLQEMD